MLNRREKIGNDLHPLYLPYYEGLCAELGPEWQPYSGRRSMEDQLRLWNKGRTTPGLQVTRAKPGDSAHNYGCATDWCLWEDNGSGVLTPRWPDVKDSAWLPYLNACQKVGAAGGYGFGDYPHNELPIRVSWRVVGDAFREHGLAAAQRVIVENLEE